jgi:hypothetical protein
MFNKKAIRRGWESNHQRLKKHQSNDDDRWRLRDWDAHPNDPGWEVGTYDSCHAEFRSKVQDGDVIFDTVYVGRAVGSAPIIRSAFVVDDASNGVLSFDEFVFLDGDASNGVQARMPRGHCSLDRTQAEEYLHQIDARDAYTQYCVGSKPKSVPTELWDKMLEKAGTASVCRSRSDLGKCGGSDSEGGCD